MQSIRKIAYPLAVFYGWITAFRNFLYNKSILKATRFRTPTIVVGNLSVGGTGKTPQIEYLIRLLYKNYRTAVLSRGYKRRSKGFQLAKEGHDAEFLGDEPFQYFSKFPEVTVAVDADRKNGIEQLMQLDVKPEVILLDDAFQHRKIVGGLNILLTAYDDLYVHDFMLPTGNLRENRSGAKRAQIILVTKCPEELSESSINSICDVLQIRDDQHVFFTRISYNSMLSGPNKLEVNSLAKTEVLLVTGIANPKPLTDFLEKRNIRFQHMRFPDHHAFRKKDISEINAVFNSLNTNNKIILTTEKDYVRIFGKLKKLYFLAIRTSFIQGQEAFDNLIKNYVGESSGNGSVSKK